MHYLYVDVTAGMILGILNSEFQWITYVESDEKKPSEVIHQNIHQLIKQHHIDSKSIEYFFSAGPGSYTGMRLGEGMAQMLEWSGKKVYSFHQFEVPSLMGVQKGYWISNAFKGQFFIHHWNQTESRSELVNQTDVKLLDTQTGFTLTHDNVAFKDLQTTKSMIAENPQLLFENLKKNNVRKAPYYFRTLDEEFKQC